MGRITDLMLRIRDSLSDPNGSRWSDARLLRLIDEGQKDINIRGRLLRSKVDIAVVAEISTYALPSDAYMLTRAIASSDAQAAATISSDPDRAKLLVKSHSRMDELDPLWETAQGDGVEAIVFDKLNPGYFKVYPIPTAGDAVTESTFATDVFGVLTDSTDDVVDTYGVVTDVTTSALLTASFNSPFGAVTDMESIVTSLIVYYLSVPATLTDFALADTIEHLSIHSVFDKALKHYVIGMALRDDKDTQNRMVGNEELTFYVAELEIALTLSAMDFTSAEQYTSPTYNTGFES